MHREQKIKAPKIIPWIAHKHGITDQLGLNFWRQAAGEAEGMSGCCNSSDYYRLALNRFIELATEESEKCAKRDAHDCLPIVPNLNWLLREQNRYWQVNLLATQKACGFWLTHLNYLFSGQKLAF